MAGKETHLLIVEDDPFLARWLREVLHATGATVDEANTSEAAMRLAAVRRYDLAIVDFDLPEGEGLRVVRSCRHRGITWPIVILSVREDESDVVAGLDAGADDYLVKPVSDELLRAHLRAVLRRALTERHRRPCLAPMSYRDIRLDSAFRRVRGSRGEAPLTPKEHALLVCFLANPKRVLPRMDLLSRVWGFDFDPRTNVLDVAVHRLRGKLRAVSADVTIRSLRGMGFGLSSPREAAPAVEPHSAQSIRHQN